MVVAATAAHEHRSSRSRLRVAAGRCCGWHVLIYNYIGVLSAHARTSQTLGGFAILFTHAGGVLKWVGGERKDGSVGRSVRPAVVLRWDELLRRGKMNCYGCEWVYGWG